MSARAARVEVGMVEQADEEVRRALPRRQSVLEHRREHAAGIPHVDEVTGCAPVDGEQQRGEHPDAVADRRADERRRPGWLDCTELADLGADGAMGVHHPLRVGRRPRRVRDRARARSGRRRAGCAIGSSATRSAKRRFGPGVVADDRDPFEVGEVGTHRVEVGDEVEVAERVGGDECLHPRAVRGCTTLPSGRRSARSARRSRRGTRSRRTSRPPRPSSAVGTRPGRRGRCRARGARSRRGGPGASTSPSVPRYGRRSETHA